MKQAFKVHSVLSPLVFAFGLCFVTGPVWSVTSLNADLYSKTEYTSNAQLASTDTAEDVIQRVGVNLLLKEERKRFTADSSLNLEQTMYFNNTYDDETNVTTGFGLFNFDIIEEFLDWKTSFTRTEVINDATASNTPDNREHRNVFRTGPTLYYNINQSSTFIMSANYVQVENSSDIASDTKRFDSDATYLYQLNNVTQLNLGAAYGEVLENDDGLDDPNSALNVDKPKNTRVSVGLLRQLSKGSFGLNVGRSRSESDSDRTVEGNYFSVNFNRNEVFWHDLMLNYQESISDSSIGFDSLLVLMNSTGQTNLSPSDLASTLDIITRKSLSLSAIRVLGSLRYNISSFWSRDDYDIQLNDEESRGASLRVDYNIRAGFSLGALFQYESNKFLDRTELGSSITNTYQIDSNYRITESLSMSANMGYEQRRNPKTAFREYEEFFVGFGLNLKLL